MARFDPSIYPDRLAFEARVRRIRADELARIFGAAATWLTGGQQKFSRRAAGTVTAAGHSHPHSTR